jgi:hypothetical protein
MTLAEALSMQLVYVVTSDISSSTQTVPTRSVTINVTPFNGTRKDVIPYAPLRTVRPSLSRFIWNPKTLSNIVFRAFIPKLAPKRTSHMESIERNTCTPLSKVALGFRCTDFHENPQSLGIRSHRTSWKPEKCRKCGKISFTSFSKVWLAMHNFNGIYNKSRT